MSKRNISPDKDLERYIEFYERTKAVLLWLGVLIGLIIGVYCLTR